MDFAGRLCVAVQSLCMWDSKPNDRGINQILTQLIFPSPVTKSDVQGHVNTIQEAKKVKVRKKSISSTENNPDLWVRIIFKVTK